MTIQSGVELSWGKWHALISTLLMVCVSSHVWSNNSCTIAHGGLIQRAQNYYVLGSYLGCRTPPNGQVYAHRNIFPYSGFQVPMQVFPWVGHYKPSQRPYVDAQGNIPTLKPCGCYSVNSHKLCICYLVDSHKHCWCYSIHS